MNNHKLLRHFLIALLLVTSLGLASCRKTDKTATPTPATEETDVQQQSLPLVNPDGSPLPTPGPATSPLSP